MVIKFWPFPLYRNNKTDPEVTELLSAFIDAEDLKVVAIGDYFIDLKCGLGELSFWSENRYYAWAHQGTFTPIGRPPIKWKEAMPSRYIVKRLRQRVEELAPTRYKFFGENNA